MKSFLKIFGRVIGSIAVVVILLVGIGLAFGFIYIGVKQPNQTAANIVTVCTTSDIDKYNEIAELPVKNDEELVSKGERLQRYVDSIKSRSGFSSDATCAYMSYTAAVLTKDIDAAQTNIDTVTERAKDGVYPSANLIDLMGIESMQIRVDALKTPSGNGSEMGSG